MRLRIFLCYNKLEGDFMFLIAHLLFYIGEILLGLPGGIIMHVNRLTDDEKKIGRNNMISNIFFFIIVATAIAGGVVLQVCFADYNGWWNGITLFLTGLLSCYLTFGFLRGIHNSMLKKGSK